MTSVDTQLREWWVQYEDTARGLSLMAEAHPPMSPERGLLNTAADDIRSLVDGLKQHEVDHAVLDARVAELEQQLETIRNERQEWFEKYHDMMEKARSLDTGRLAVRVDRAEADRDRAVERAERLEQALEWIKFAADTAIREGYLHLDEWKSVQAEARAALRDTGNTEEPS